MNETNMRDPAIKRLHDYANEYLAGKRDPTDIAYDIVDLASGYPDFCKEEKEPILSKIWDIATQLELPESVSDIRHSDGWERATEVDEFALVLLSFAYRRMAHSRDRTFGRRSTMGNTVYDSTRLQPPYK